MPSNSISKFSAFTLIEILVTIVVISIAGTALMGVYTNMVAKSADPLIQQQALAIAEAYMEEIRLKAFTDPNDPGGGVEARADFDDILDYNRLPDTTVRDQNGAEILSLSSYSVAVAVAGQPIAAIGVANSVRIDVVVSHPAIAPITLSSFRANY